MRCRICDADARRLFSAKVLRRHEVGYWRCQACGFIQTEQPYWLPEAYRSALNITDTGLVARNIGYARSIALLMFFFIDRRGVGVDVGGGSGMLTRLLRDTGFDWYWRDPYSENLFARGFEYDPARVPDVDLVTALEVFEHAVEPRDTVRGLLEIAPRIFFSTELVPEPAPTRVDDWWYFAPEHGQHVGFFTRQSLVRLANEFGLHLYTNGSHAHIMSREPLRWFSFRRLEALGRLRLHAVVRRSLPSRTESDRRILLDKEGRPDGAEP